MLASDSKRDIIVPIAESSWKPYEFNDEAQSAYASY